MPTYDYECKACHHRFDLFQSMSDPHKRKCPKCGKNTLERLIGTGAALIFKGSGFYQTDYRSDSYKKSADADKKPAESKSDAKPDGKSDSKSDGKAAEAKGAKPAGKPEAPTKSAEPATPSKTPEPKAPRSDSPKGARDKPGSSKR